MTEFIVAGALGLTAMVLRVLPNLLANGVLGVDHWYWKSYVENYRVNKRFPPQLPQYLLDQHQWYPPVFPLLVTAFPDSVFARSNQVIAIGIDLLRMSLVLAVSFWITGGNMMAMVMAGIIYATSPILVSYNTQLNPRGLGALVLDSVLCLFVWSEALGGSWLIWGIIALLAGGMLLTHKMTTQLFWFLCPSIGLIMGDWRVVLLIPVSIGVAILLSKGFYINVMQAHWDVVSFWHRNWRWLQVHPVKESPVYGEPGFETPTKFYRKGLPGLISHARYLIGFSPAVWIIVGAAITAGAFFSGASYQVVVMWGVLCLAFSLLTLFVPFLKCLGSGYFYLYNAVFPIALTGAMIFRHYPELAGVLWLAVAANLLALGFYYRSVVQSKRTQHDGNFDQALKFLKTARKGTVMCLPLQWSDLIAYKTGQQVLWGAHGYGFKMVEPIFPRLLLPIQEVIYRYRVRYLITRDGYLTEAFLGALPYESVVKFGDYRIFVTES